MKDAPALTDSAVKEIFDEFDQNHSGTVSFTELDAASSKLAKRIQETSGNSDKVESLISCI